VWLFLLLLVLVLLFLLVLVLVHLVLPIEQALLSVLVLFSPLWLR
jgi:hypothetical protein